MDKTYDLRKTNANDNGCEGDYFCATGLPAEQKSTEEDSEDGCSGANNLVKLRNRLGLLAVIVVMKPLRRP